MNDKLRLHIGCGPIRLAGWTNIDKNPSDATDVVMDALQISAQFGEGVADYIYACHMLEHLAYPNDVMTFLKVAHHTLAKHGVIRIAVPDLKKVAMAYANGSDLKFIYGESHRGFYHKDCAAERFTYFARSWEHTILFDFELLSDLLNDAGFASWCQKPFNSSIIPDFHHDRFQSESLYVEAIK